MTDMFVPPPIRCLFNKLTSGQFENFDIIPCTVLDEVSFAIVAVHDTRNGYEMTPLFVLATPGLRVSQRGGGGGPKRQFSAAEFEVAHPAGPH